MGVKGYKAFDSDWTCKEFQYKVGETYEMEGKPEICRNGFHFCTDLKDCFKYYDFDPKTKIAEVVALGDIDSGTDDTKMCTNKIKIVRKLNWQEVLEKSNIGKNSMGYGNIGNFNTGNLNTGHYNTGNNNTGNHNTGHNNIGNSNCGSYNKGTGNIGADNSGNYNTSSHNQGDHNSGNDNCGNFNAGRINKGDFNTGNFNTGHRNAGFYNVGNYNTGDFNKTNYSTGCFNTEKPVFYMFNKPTNWTIEDWKESRAFVLIEDYMIEKQLCNEFSEKEESFWWWSQLLEKDKQAILSLPNFDADIFEEITGINVKEEK